MSIEQQIQVLYEITMSIGNSDDIEEMLQQSLLVYLKKLNCVSAFIYTTKSTNVNRFETELFFHLPYSVNISQVYPEVHALLQKRFNHNKYNEFKKQLTLTICTRDNKFCHIMELSDFGFLVLVKNRFPLEDEIIRNLEDVNKKLSLACRNCINIATLRESEEKYKDLTEFLPEMICEVDMRGYITYANTYSIVKMGYTPREVIKGFHVSKLFVLEDRDLVLQNFRNTIVQAMYEPQEYTAITKSGEEIPVIVYSSPILKDNLIIGIRGVMIDISERKKNEKLFKRYTEQLEMAILGSDAGFWDWNILTNAVFYSDRWCSMLGYQSSEIDQNISTWRKLIHIDDIDFVNEEFERHLNGSVNVYRTEHRLLTKSGEWKWVLDIGRITERDKYGKPTRATGIHIDISEQKSAEFLITVEQELKLKLSKSKSLDEILDQCFDTIKEKCGLDLLGVYSFDIKQNSYNLIKHVGLSEDFVKNSFTFPIDSDNAKLILKGEPLYLSDSNLSDKLRAEGVAFFAVLPIIFQDTVIGSLNVASKLENTLTELTKKVLEIVASTIGSYIISIQHEERIKQSTEDLKALFNTIDDFIFILDFNGSILHVNNVVYKYLGYSQDEILHKSVLAMHPEDRRNEANEIIEKMLSGDKNYCYVPLIAKNGKLVPVETKVIIGKWMNQLAIIGISRDITERNKIEKKLREQSQELAHGLKQQTILSDIALMLNSIGDFDIKMNAILKDIGQHTDVSRVYIFENDKEEMFTSNTFEWCNVNVLPQINELQNIPYEIIPSFKTIFSKSGRIYSENISELPQDLREILEPQNIKSIVIYPLYIQNKFFGFIGIDECSKTKCWSKSELELLRTISGIISNAYERIIMDKVLIEERDKAKQANQAKSEFMANMSHEIRTPMNAILGFSEALFRKTESLQHQKMLKSILSSGNLLLSLLNEILDLSKIEAGKMIISPQPVDLVNILNEINMLFSENARRKNISLLLDIENNFPPAVLLDEIRIKQVLFNIVGNAVKFTHEGFIKISLKFNSSSSEGGELLVLVEDSGIGIPENQKQLIFEAFQQQEGQSTRKYGGTGLGLAISKRLIDKMDGVIEVDSTVGVGSTFIIRLKDIKICEAGMRNNASHDIDPDAIIFEKSTIMIVDDVLSNIEAVENFLISSNLTTITAESGDIALEILNHTTPSLILLDLRMPGTDGFTVAKIVKSKEHLKHIPVIAYTASVFSAGKLEKDENFSNVLFKPVSKRELIGMLTKYLPYESIDNDGLLKNEFLESTEIQYEAISREKIDYIHSYFFPLWNQIKDTFILFKIEDFNKQLLEYSKENSIEILVKYCQNLSENLITLDLEAIKNDLSNFDTVVKKIQIA